MKVRKVLTLDGGPEGGSLAARRAEELDAVLAARGIDSRTIVLRDGMIKPCTGCFGCWVKKPGECLFDDGSGEVLREALAADFVLLASPLIAGFPSALLKRAVDKMIPLVHPYAEFVGGELHHRARYARYPRFGLILDPRPGDEDDDAEIAARVFARTALNFKSELAFCFQANRTAQEIASALLEEGRAPLPNRAPRGRGGLPWESAGKGRSLLVVNGSPRGKGGNTELLLGRLASGFASTGAQPPETIRLALPSEAARAVELARRSEILMLGFPLYTDSMPSIAKAFIEDLASPGGGPSPEAGPSAIGFAVQCGFPELAHIRPLERYLERLPRRLGAKYLGTVARSDGEGIRLMPPSMMAPLFSSMEGIGRGLAENGSIDPALAARLGGMERISLPLRLLWSVLSVTGLQNRHWNALLERNGTRRESFARPFARKEP